MATLMVFDPAIRQQERHRFGFAGLNSKPTSGKTVLLKTSKMCRTEGINKSASTQKLLPTLSRHSPTYHFRITTTQTNCLPGSKRALLHLHIVSVESNRIVDNTWAHRVRHVQRCLIRFWTGHLVSIEIDEGSVVKAIELQMYVNVLYDKKICLLLPTNPHGGWNSIRMQKLWHICSCVFGSRWIAALNERWNDGGCFLG